MVIVFDLDGVVYLGDTPIPGAVEALNGLAAQGHSLWFLTNNSTRSRRDYAEKLSRMGIPTTPEQVMTSSYATALYLKEQGAAGKTVYVVGERGIGEEMTNAGLRVLPDETEGPADYVVVGLDRNLTYDRMARAHEKIRQGARFVATNRDATYPMEVGEIPGGGAMVVFLEYSTRVTPVTIGKPEVGMWERILAVSGVQPSEALMIGDRPETDIMGAKRVGLRTALVLSGVTPAEAVATLPDEQQSDFVISSVVELHRVVEQLAG